MMTPSRLCIFFAILFTVPLVSLAAERVALVIGVNQYENLPGNAQLRVAVSDAELMARTLEALDPPFQVTLLTDVGHDIADEKFEAFLKLAAGAECALLYFGGHGIEYHGANYLLVKDTTISEISPDVELMKRRLGREALSLQAMVDSLDLTGAQVKLVVLDCCRDNPLTSEVPGGSRSVVGGSSGLAQVAAPSGTLISYSADAGQKANDGLFTAVLAENLKKPGLTAVQVFATTRDQVREISTAWAAEDADKGLDPDFRRVRHEPAEYTKLNLAGTNFTFTRGVPVKGKGAGSRTNAEMLQLRADLAKAEAEREAASQGNAARMERLQKELKEARAKAAVSVSATPTVPSTPITMVETNPSTAPAFSASRGMEGSRAGEVREFGGIEMVWCPAGEFLMGSPSGEADRSSDETEHRVTLTRGFWLAKTETTQAQWEAVAGNNPSSFKGAPFPVDNVSWDDATNWFSKMNTRHPLPEGWNWELPTEAQWEYACRAGTGSAFSFGSILNGTQANCNGSYPYGTSTKGPYLQGTTKVASYPANAWGLHDMHGNVWEWCRDWYGGYPSGSASDPNGSTMGDHRVDRGGSWDLDAQYCRSSTRGYYAQDYRHNDLGFRPALVPSSNQPAGRSRKFFKKD